MVGAVGFEPTYAAVKEQWLKPLADTPTKNVINEKTPED